MKNLTCDICKKNPGITFDIPKGVGCTASSIDLCKACQLSLMLSDINNMVYLQDQIPEQYIVKWIMELREQPNSVAVFWKVVNYMIWVYSNA